MFGGFLPNWVQRALWWTAKRIFPVRKIGGIEFLDMRSGREKDTTEIQDILREALDRIRAARGGFDELVVDHLHFVAAMDLAAGHTLPAVRGYAYPFTGADRENGHALACRLIWVATAIRLARDAAAQGRSPDAAAVRQACHEARLRFVRQFPDSEQWESYLERGYED